MRLDQALTHLKIAPSRAKAQELIRTGQVELLVGESWQAVKDVSRFVENLKPEQVRLKNDELLRYVSRGGLKLEWALAHLGLSVKGLYCLDIGQSTGGFTHCLLEHGAAEVWGYDVGHGQLHNSLREDPRVRFFEGVHVKDLKLERSFDLCVVDVSFISLAAVLPVLQRSLQGKVKLLMLVKPQFELDARALNKKGVVTDEKLLQSVKNKISTMALENGCNILDYFACELKGQDGNQEYFLYAEKIVGD